MPNVNVDHFLQLDLRAEFEKLRQRLGTSLDPLPGIDSLLPIPVSSTGQALDPRKGLVVRHVSAAKTVRCSKTGSSNTNIHQACCPRQSQWGCPGVGVGEERRYISDTAYRNTDPNAPVVHS